MSDNHPKLGHLALANGERDAVHIAIVSVRALWALEPGDRVKLESEFAVKANSGAIGIVDPFLEDAIKPGEFFWLCLFPNSTTSLRHVWTHPAFAKAQEPLNEDAQVVQQSHVWIEDFAERVARCSARTFLSYAKAYQESIQKGYGGCWPDNSSWEWKEHEAEFPEFWRHYEIVTGEHVSDKAKTEFGCAC